MTNHHQALTDIQAAVQALHQTLADHLSSGTMGIDRDDVSRLRDALNRLDCVDTDLGIVISRVPGG
jgi:hypothetical protein